MDRIVKATELTALLVRRLATPPAGFRHIDRVVEPVGFLTELAEHGFELDLGAHYDAG
jgi:hypothetical protein